MAIRDESETKTPTGETTSGSSEESSDSGSIPVLMSSIGSGLLAQQPTPTAEAPVTVAKVCPQCGTEYETGDRFCPKDGAPLKPKGGGDPMIGRVIADRYLILARLGEGGMGRVYAAEHVKMNRQCAIKVMNPALMHDAESTKRFAREASNAARILHPNVAAVFDYGEADKIVYLVMEYIDGEPLSSILAREGTLDPRRAVDIARQVADGLTAAHELGIIHRDLKPDNVLIARRRDGRETAKVVDFGIAKAVSDAPQDALTRSGLVIGTPEFMSPEQLLGDPVDARTDIYALGCILYQMLTGSQPFDSETREQMIRRRLNEPPPHIREALAGLPRRLDTLIAHMLARSPGDRLASAAEVSSSLDPALALSGWVPAPAGVAVTKIPRGAPTVIRSSADPAMQPTIPIQAQKTSPTRIALGVVVGSFVVALGFLAFAQGSSPTAATPAPVTSAPVRVDSTTPALPVATVVDTNAVVGSSSSTAASTVRPDSTPAVVRPPARQTGSRPTTPVGKKGASRVEPVPDAPQRPQSALPRSREEAPPTDEASIRETLNHFATAMANGEIALRQEVPSTPQRTLDDLKKIETEGENIRAVPVPGSIRVTGDRSEFQLTVRVSYVARDSKAQMMTPFRFRATLQKRGGKWEITDLSTP